MEDKPKVSIIIPIYNAEKYIYQGLSSLKEQTLKEIEIIMVNDGSTDASESICKSFSDHDKRFILINQENGGSAAARRTGMLAAQGEYIGFIDADDWCEPDMFEKLYDAGMKNDVDIVFCNCFREFPDRQLACRRQIREGYYNREQILNEILPYSLGYFDSKGEYRVIRWANYLRIYRRSLIVEHNVYNDPTFRRCQDLQITFEATLYAQSYFYMGDEHLYHNRVVDDSQSRGYTKDFWKKLRGLINKLYNDVDCFKERDFLNVMHLCAFFFAIQACSNEKKHKGEVSKREILNNLSEIITDNICFTAANEVKFEKMRLLYRLYKTAFCKRSLKLAYSVIMIEDYVMCYDKVKSKVGYLLRKKR